MRRAAPAPLRPSLLLAVLLPVAAGLPLAAQATDSTQADSTKVDSAPPVPPPPPFIPTPEQQRYLDGLKRVGRGIAQLKVAVDQATRAQAATDTVARRRAAARLGGFCGSARSFMTGGRAQMQPLVFEDTLRLKAQRLTQRVGEIITYTRTCETEAAGAPARVSGEVVRRLQFYEAALAEFRSAVGLPNN